MKTSPLSERELTLTRIIPAPPEKIFRAWTDPKLLIQWFCPLPWTVSAAEIDPRSGGTMNVTMRSPEGVDSPMRGIYLDVIPNERIVFTDAYVSTWEPSEKPFMTAIITLEKVSEGTRYTARVLHWTVADREAHEKMGFHDGWGKCTDQLAALLNH